MKKSNQLNIVFRIFFMQLFIYNDTYVHLQFLNKKLNFTKK